MSTKGIRIDSGPHTLILEQCPRGGNCHPMLLLKNGLRVGDASPTNLTDALAALDEWQLDLSAVITFSAAINAAPHFNPPAAQAA